MLTRLPRFLRLATLGLCAAGLLASPALASDAKKVLRLWMSGPITEAPNEQQALAALLGGQKTNTLWGHVATIRDAAERDDIDGLVLIVDNPLAGFAQAEELIRAIRVLPQHRQAGPRLPRLRRQPELSHRERRRPHHDCRAQLARHHRAQCPDEFL
jgi:hypothetical protein